MRFRLLAPFVIAVAIFGIIVILGLDEGGPSLKDSLDDAPGIEVVDRRPGSVQFEDVSRHDSPSAATPYQLPCTTIDEPANFAHFSLGSAVEDYFVTYVGRECRGRANANRVQPNLVWYTYGRCKAVGEAGCTPPLQILSYPACQRNLSDYEIPSGRPAPRPRLVRWKRGAISASFSEGTRVEVYTGTSTIVLFGNDPDFVAGALGILRQESQDEEIQEPAEEPEHPIGVDALPPPTSGALQGSITCPTPE